jgi:cytochrome bd-type quinol oxidase subunit 2
MATESLLFQNERMKKYGLLVLICTTLGLLFFIYIFYSNHGRFPSIQLEAEEYLACTLITNLAGFLAWKLDKQLDRWIHWRSHFLLRFLSGFLLNGIVVIVFVITSTLLILDSSQQDMIKLGILLAIALFIYEIFYGLFYSYRLLRQNPDRTDAVR